MSSNKDIDHLPGGAPLLADTLAAREKSFPQVRVIEKDGELGPETWSMVNRKRGKGYDVMAELAGPHIGNGQPEARRRSVTIDRVVPEELLHVYERARAR
jgi:hypothetical protein